MTITKRLLSSSVSLKNKRVRGTSGSTASGDAYTAQSGDSGQATAHKSKSHAKYTKFPRILSTQSIYESSPYLIPIQHRNPLGADLKVVSGAGEEESSGASEYQGLYSPAGLKMDYANQTRVKQSTMVKRAGMWGEGSGDLAYDMFFASHRPLNLGRLASSVYGNTSVGPARSGKSIFKELHESIAQVAPLSVSRNAVPQDGSYSEAFHEKMKGSNGQGGIESIGFQAPYRYAARVPKELMIYLNKNMISTVGVISCMFMECDKSWIKVGDASSGAAGERYQHSSGRSGSEKQLYKPYSLEKEMDFFHKLWKSKKKQGKLN